MWTIWRIPAGWRCVSRRRQPAGESAGGCALFPLFSHTTLPPVIATLGLQAFCRKFHWSELMIWPQDLPRRRWGGSCLHTCPWQHVLHLCTSGLLRDACDSSTWPQDLPHHHSNPLRLTHPPTHPPTPSVQLGGAVWPGRSCAQLAGAGASQGHRPPRKGAFRARAAGATTCRLDLGWRPDF